MRLPPPLPKVARRISTSFLRYSASIHDLPLCFTHAVIFIFFAGFPSFKMRFAKKTEENKSAVSGRLKLRQGSASAKITPINLLKLSRKTLCNLFTPPVWRDACWIKVQANQPLSLRDSRTKQLLPAGSSACGFNCLPCCTSSLPPLISPKEKKRAALTGGSIGIQFCRKQPFYHSGQMWKSVSVGSKKYIWRYSTTTGCFLFPSLKV